jgi:hypothetical protein
MWDDTHHPPHMEDAVAAYERTFCLRNDIESGTTLAFLLNARSSISDPADAIADFVQANRVRDRVVQLCEAALQVERSRSTAGPAETSSASGGEVTRKYRVRAAMAEAHLGLGNRDEAKRWETEALGIDVPQRLKGETARRLSTLGALLSQSPLRFLAT